MYLLVLKVVQMEFQELLHDRLEVQVRTRKFAVLDGLCIERSKIHCFTKARERLFGKDWELEPPQVQLTSMRMGSFPETPHG